MADSIETFEERASQLRDLERKQRVAGSILLAAGLFIGAGIAVEATDEGPTDKIAQVMIGVDAFVLSCGMLLNSESHSVGRKADTIDAEILRLRATMPT